jgi:DNA-binding MurR/RpiR family transcriptional regulator
VAVTDSLQAPAAKIAQYTLVAKSDMVSIVDSLVAPLSLINALIVAIGRKKETELSRTYEELERMWAEYEVYERVRS